MWRPRSTSKRRPSSPSIRVCAMLPVRNRLFVVPSDAERRRGPTGGRDVWPTSGQFFAEHDVTARSHPSYRYENPETRRRSSRGGGGSTIAENPVRLWQLRSTSVGGIGRRRRTSEFRDQSWPTTGGRSGRRLLRAMISLQWGAVPPGYAYSLRQAGRRKHRSDDVEFVNTL